MVNYCICICWCWQLKVQKVSIRCSVVAQLPKLHKLAGNCQNGHFPFFFHPIMCPWAQTLWQYIKRCYLMLLQFHYILIYVMIQWWYNDDTCDDTVNTETDLEAHTEGKHNTFQLAFLMLVRKKKLFLMHMHGSKTLGILKAFAAEVFCL